MKTFSVGFFKRCILVILALLILVPTGLAIYFGVKSARQTEQVEKLELRLEQAERDAQQAQTDAALQGEPTDYQLLYPDLYSAAQVPENREKASKTVYLTFDGSPSPNTEDILETLDEYGVKATFFVTGHEDADSLKTLKEISRRGHAVGLSSYSGSLEEVYSSVTSYLDDFNRIYQLVYEITGERAEIFRFPAGSVNSYNSGFYRELIAEMLRRGFVFFDWNVSGETTGSDGTSAQRVRENVMEGVDGKDRAVIMLQDAYGKESSAEALPDIIDSLRSEGYSFGTLSAETLPVVFSYNSAP